MNKLVIYGLGLLTALLPYTGLGQTAKKIRLDKVANVKLEGRVTPTSINKVIKEMESLKSKTIYLLIDSEGGDVDAGNVLISYIKASPKTINTVCLLKCYSMAAYIFNSGKVRYMTGTAELLYHSVSIAIEGKIEKVYDAVRDALMEYRILNEAVAVKSKLPVALVHKLINNTIIVNKKQAIILGFADSEIVVE